MKDMVNCLQMYYKGRLCRMFVVNTSALIYLLWKVVETFMDSNTRGKISLFYSVKPKELLEYIHPSQLINTYGGECEPPTEYWPPIFPSAPFRDEFITKHNTEEEFKVELVANPQVVPSPNLAGFARASRHHKSKKGPFPHKTYVTSEGLERRDSFNGIIDDESKTKVTEFRGENMEEKKADEKALTQLAPLSINPETKSEPIDKKVANQIVKDEAPPIVKDALVPAPKEESKGASNAVTHCEDVPIKTENIKIRVAEEMVITEEKKLPPANQIMISKDEPAQEKDKNKDIPQAEGKVLADDQCKLEFIQEPELKEYNLKKPTRESNVPVQKEEKNPETPQSNMSPKSKASSQNLSPEKEASKNKAGCSCILF